MVVARWLVAGRPKHRKRVKLPNRDCKSHKGDLSNQCSSPGTYPERTDRTVHVAPSRIASGEDQYGKCPGDSLGQVDTQDVLVRRGPHSFAELEPYRRQRTLSQRSAIDPPESDISCSRTDPQIVAVT